MSLVIMAYNLTGDHKMYSSTITNSYCEIHAAFGGKVQLIEAGLRAIDYSVIPLGEFNCLYASITESVCD